MQLGVSFHYLDPLTNDLLGDRPFAGPFAVEHECVAEVVNCGEDVRGLARGDKVIVPWAISCGSCLLCQAGLTSRCSDAGETLLSAFGLDPAMGPWDGLVSDLVRVPFARQLLVRVPEGIEACYAIRSLAPGGVCTSVGIYFQRDTSIPLLQMFANDSTLRADVSHPRGALPAVLELIRGGRFQPQKITTVLANWADAAEAWLERTTKVVVYRPALY